MNLAYRISTTILGVATIICAFFLKMFTFTLVIATVYPKTYNFSIYDAIGKLTENGISIGSGENSAAVREAIAPMLNTTVAFFVLLAVTLVFILAITIISGVSNLHVPQAVLSGLGFVLMVVAAGCASKALGCLLENEKTGEAAKVTLTALITASGLTTENALSALGSALTKVQIASLSYGFYVIMAVLAVMFIWSIIAAVRYNSDQPVKVHKKRHKEYRRKKPLRKII
ncbi:MAG: hypothetical protein ACI4RU_00015 [Acutalibacteraceae bacterium]